MTTEDDAMSTGKPDHEITDVNRAYQADDADLTIISADGIHFKVHRVVLLLASTVFKAMLAIPTSATDANDPFTLSHSDTAIENGNSIKAFLDLLYSQPVPTTTNDSNIAALKLVQKYECSATRRLLLHAYADYIFREQISGIQAFQAAAILDSPSTCELAIREKRSLVWINPDSGGLLKEHVSEQPSFDLRAMQYDMMETIPFKYLVALLRAHLVVDLGATTKLAGRNMTQVEKDKMADEFKRLMA